MNGFGNRIATLFTAVIFTGGLLHAQTINISPGYVNIPLGGTQQYTATVTGLTPNTVTWGITAGGGTISPTGLYTAPAKVPANSVLISATSVANPKIAAYVYVNPEAPGPTLLTISPSPLPVGNDTITITANPATPFVKGASMLCNGAGLTTKFISATQVSAVMYVGSAMANVSCSVTNPGYWQSNTLTVPVSAGPPTPAPVVSPATVNVALGTTQQFSAQNVTSWQASVGTITANGLYTAPATGTGTATITATGPGGSSTATVTLLQKILVSPAAATAVLGATLQFSAAGATSWKAVSGSVTSAGLYTAPASMPASGIDTVTATGPGGTGSAVVTLQNYPAPVLTSINPPALPLGVFNATIAGAGFTTTTTAALGSTQLVVTAWSATSLSVTGFASATGTLSLIAANGSAASAPLTVQVGNPNALVSAAAARRFLEQAAFGPSPADAANVQALGFQGWINQQLAMPAVSNYNAQLANSQGGMREQFMTNAVMNPDQLRQRVAFALSQIFVTSFNTIIWNGSMAPYEQMLINDAFSNYRQILGDVTLSPTMGQYLNMANNAQANPSSGTVANENYAREVMQLFSVGTVLLNPDGTPQLDGNGLMIPTYTQATIAETARVFTGWTYLPSQGQPLAWGDYINPAGPMQPWPAEHDMGSKVLLSGYQEPAGLSPRQDLDNTLDNIFNHPNVGPFVGKLLIQHLVKSNPSPAYVSRVAAAFNNNGSGVRGDMQAVVTAILLDPEARANDNGGNDQPGDGHLQEPALFIAGIYRAFGGAMTTQNYFGWDLGNLSEDIFNAPSVFNYFSPTFMPPGNTFLGPEFQIDTPDSAVYRANMVANIFSSWSNPVLNYGPGTNIDVTPYQSLAPTPALLVAALDLTLTHGTMPAAMKQDIVSAVTADTNGNLSRVLTGAWLILSSSYYNVWH